MWATLALILWLMVVPLAAGAGGGSLAWMVFHHTGAALTGAVLSFLGGVALGLYLWDLHLSRIVDQEVRK